MIRQKKLPTDSRIWDRIADAIAEATGASFRPKETADLGGGCINRALRMSDGERSFFVKVNEPRSMQMFEAERAGLAELATLGGPRVPMSIASGSTEEAAFLVLEFIPLSRPSGEAWARLGEQLAMLHQRSAQEFGWGRENTIGSTPQDNDWMADWIDFWRERRLGYQLRIAACNGLDPATVSRGDRLLDRLDDLLGGHAPKPSLLHGDLWSGNVAADAGGNPVVFDPAVYYGDREVDLAMTELFGSFDRRFYSAYRDAWPVSPGYEVRKVLYNLYHVLNHFNLFGGGYGARAGAMIEHLSSP